MLPAIFAIWGNWWRYFWRLLHLCKCLDELDQWFGFVGETWYSELLDQGRPLAFVREKQGQFHVLSLGSKLVSIFLLKRENDIKCKQIKDSHCFGWSRQLRNNQLDIVLERVHRADEELQLDGDWPGRTVLRGRSSES